MRAEAHAPRAVPEEGLECASGAGGALAARPAAGLPGAAAVEEGGGRLHNRGARRQELPPQSGLARMSEAQQIESMFRDMLRWQMSGGQDLPAWYRPAQAPAVSSWPAVSSYNFRPVPYDVLKRQHEADLERMLQAAERMPGDADPERVELIPGLFDEMAAALPYPQRRPAGQRAERPAHPAAMRAAEPAFAEALADAAAPGAAAAGLHPGHYTAAQLKQLAELSRTIQDAEGGRSLHWPSTEAASREAAMALMRDDAAGLRLAMPELPVVPNCMAFYRMYACGANGRPALTRMDELTGSTAWRSGGNKPERWRKIERFAAIIEEGLPRNDDGEVSAEDGLAAAARMDRLRGQMRIPSFIKHIFHERAAAKKAAQAAAPAVAASAAAALLG